MSTLLTVKQVKSLTVGFVLSETYDIGRIEEIKVYLGKNIYPHTIDGRVVKCQIKSDDTAVMYGANRLSFWLDDSIIGVYPVYCGDIIFEYTNAIEHNESVNTGFDLLVNLAISETAITVGDVLYNYVKGDKGDPFTYDDFTPEQIAELQQPAADTIASIEAVELAVEQAEALRVTAEQSRQTNTATAIQNAENATTDAGNAAILANEKAGLANEKALLANEKAGLADSKATLADNAAALATEIATHPDIVVADYWHKWNTTTKAYETTGIKAKGEPGAVAVVKQLTGTSETDVMSQKAVTNEITPLQNLQNGIFIPKNLYNYRSAKSGYIDSSGNLNTLTSYINSQKFKVKSGTTYKTANCVHVVQYSGVNGETFISMSGISGDTFTTNTTTTYVIVNILKTNKYTAQVNEGSTLLTYDDGALASVTGMFKYDKENQITSNKSDVERIKATFILNDNLLDLTKITQGKQINKDGLIQDVAGWAYSDLIAVTAGQVLYMRDCSYVCAYNQYGDVVPSSGSTTLYGITYTVPSGIVAIRTCIEFSKVNTIYYPFVSLSSSSPRTQYGYSISRARLKNRLKLSDAYAAIQNGDAFKIGFYGDSTFEGVGTTGWASGVNNHAKQDSDAGGVGVVDYINTNAFPYKLEQLLKTEYGNSSVRVYNIGYSGASLNNNKATLNQIFSGAYAGVQMVGLGMGLNDRFDYTTQKAFYSGLKNSLREYVYFFEQKSITPFFVTAQIVLEVGGESANPTKVYDNYIQKIANQVKYELANELDLEIVDLNDFTSKLLRNSDYALTDLIDGAFVHFKDIGHTQEAGYLFTKFCPYISYSDNKNEIYLGLTDVNLRSDIYASQCVSSSDKFKLKMNFDKGNTNDVTLFDIYFFNNSGGSYNAEFQTDEATGYIIINGVTTNITSTVMTLPKLDIGLHHIIVKSGVNTKAVMKGFRLTL